MIRNRPMALLALAAGLSLASAGLADELRNLKPGEAVPAFSLATIAGNPLESSTLKGSVTVVVYLTAEQRASELAAADSIAVARGLAGQPVHLVHITADADRKDYFQAFRRDHPTDAPLAFDTDRSLCHKLGMIVYPTTIIIDREGKLSHVISLRGPDYARVLEAHTRFALGALSADQLEAALKGPLPADGPGHGLASAHRASARSLRERGRFDAARQELLLARDEFPADHDLVLDLADVSLATGHLDEADAIIDDLLKIQPDDRRATQLKGISLYRRNRLDESESVLTKALILNPEPGRVHYYLGRIHEQRGQMAKALEHYHEALRRALHEPEEAAPAPDTPAAPAPQPDNAPARLPAANGR